MSQSQTFKTNKPLIIGFFIIYLSSISFAQDSLKSIKVSYNFIQGLINEQSVYIDVSPFRHHSFGCSIGKVTENSVFAVFILSPSQNLYPGTVYKGNVFRINYSYIFQKRKTFDYYIGAQYIYKDMFYNNKYFRDGGDTHVNYWRNEKATVFGFDLVTGLNKYINFKKHFSLLLNVYSGIGWRERHRAIETYIIQWYGSYYYTKTTPPILGNETKIQQFWLPVLGVKLGLQFRI